MRVLIVKLGAIGDVVMASPMAEAARRLDPDAEVVWLCGRTVEPLVRALGVADEVIAVDDRALLAGSKTEKARALAAAWRSLAGQRFDLVATGYSDPRYAILTRGVRARRRRSWGRRRSRPWPVPGRYHGDEYVRLIVGTDGPSDERIPLPEVDFPLSGRLEEALADAKAPVAALVPGGAKNLLREDAIRRWPLESYAALARRLAEREFEVLVAGAPSDEWVRPAFASIPVLDLIGKTDLLELCALLQRSDVVVTHDSGPMHLAVLARTPLVALFGPTNPHERLVPSDTVRVVWGGADLPCRPCYDGTGYAPSASAETNICLRSITVERVEEAVHELVAPVGVPA